MKHVLSVQSWVTYGHVGNAAAVLPLQRLGCEVWAVHTVQFSNHTGYGSWTGRVNSVEEIASLLEGMDQRGIFSTCDAVLSGYLGDVRIGTVVLDAVRCAKAQNPAALYCCDPVLGDVGRGIFVKPGIPEFFKHTAVALADIVTPNQFELEYLTDCKIRNLSEACLAANRLLQQGPTYVLVTSLQRSDAPSDTTEMLLATKQQSYLVQTPLLPLHVNGAGDATAALLLGHLLQGASPKAALEKTAAGMFALLQETLTSGSREIQLVAAQDKMVKPSDLFSATALT